MRITNNAIQILGGELGSNAQDCGMVESGFRFVHIPHRIAFLSMNLNPLQLEVLISHTSSLCPTRFFE